MTEMGKFKFLIIDDFMPGSFVNGLLEYSLEHQGSFVPTQVKRKGDYHTSYDKRMSQACSIGLGPFEEAFSGAIDVHLAQFFRALGVQPFAIARTDIELVAHGEGGMFAPHLDTATEANRHGDSTDRVLSAVYYFHRMPKHFSGGELAIYPIRNDAAIEVLQPVANRLAVFPSFAPHEVRKILCPSKDFADSRFFDQLLASPGARRRVSLRRNNAGNPPGRSS